ncbi:MAG: UDP-N-acetylmuramoyl-L-alanyl-D-glutamate--2,6-diaminopimelate ligase [Planctomycetes bacterium]|nr:UDP-N-acetylmuramoyl-L-alanyl-D-glutamate--2,6-diaminopimelate ligase [Planctomycetota bacterium]
MNLVNLQKAIPDASCWDFEACEIAGLTHDSRSVKRDYAFFAIAGHRDDGHRYVEEALERGARALVVGRRLPRLSRPVPQLVVQDVRLALAHAARLFYGVPSQRVRVSAITGTNGKTSTTYLSQAMLESDGFRVGRMTTVTVDVGSRCFPATHTTPESVDIQGYLAEMRESGLQVAVMEASSHALDQGRLAGVDVETAVFTNLTPDHLDYHGDMDGYRESKAKLFEMLSPAGWAIVNQDDPSSVRLVRGCRARQLGYGLEDSADVTAEVQAAAATGTRFLLRTPAGSEEMWSPLLGRHNVYNVLAAAANALALGAHLPAVCSAVAAFQGVPGRLQRVDRGQPFTVLVDYAHTADALRNVLGTLRPLRAGGRLLLVFGCGGDRDRTKRPRMAEAAEALSDFFWITSDNPRTEDPEQIFRDILSGVSPRARFELVADRRAAIAAAIAAARPRDIVLIAGKGHENVQIVGARRLHFDDVEEAAGALERRAESEPAPGPVSPVAAPAPVPAPAPTRTAPQAVRPLPPSPGRFPLTLGEAALALGTAVVGPWSSLTLSGVSTDSRAIERGALFVALRGERFDGHGFVAAAAAAGAVAAVVEGSARPAGVPEDFPLVRVGDSTQALGRLAQACRRRSRARVLAVTGSNGKTTVKTFTTALLEAFGPVCGSPKSFNNRIGMPLTLLAARPEHRWVVLEMGTNHFGELAELAAVAEPEVAAVTNIGDTHLEFLGDREGVARAKAELLEALPESGVAVLNADDAFFPFLRSRVRGRVVTFGLGPGSDLFATDVRPAGRGCRFRVNGCFEAELAVPGAYNVRNALAALALGSACGLDPEAMSPGVRGFELPPLRLEMRRVGRLTCVLDAYNANPTSMALAVEEFERWPVGGRRILVLGEMRELGPRSAECHAALGREVARRAWDTLVTVGAGARGLAEAAKAGGGRPEHVRHFDDRDEAARVLAREARAGDTLFFKGSRGMALERIVEALEAAASPGHRGGNS